ncbi:hypothetical protein LF1_52320 [Rubripirellula obstinata]|uniref:Uncharacterized protein n=1 Tax=Rubripirellula obstinata TaxID=406547 RepID=A0A5B1CD93_9BACT|nr:hypothetical protein LF1_52320 [Rubripirellula obstinata]
MTANTALPQRSINIEMPTALRGTTNAWLSMLNQC